MNYYDELGIAPHSSTGQIRHAYRLLARLLHPDRFADDEELRVVAGRQMQHLNDVLATLTHVERRRQYDESLGTAAPLPETAVPQPEQRRWRQAFESASRHWFGILAALVCVVPAIWYWPAGRRQPALPAGLTTTAPPAPAAIRKRTVRHETPVQANAAQAAPPSSLSTAAPVSAEPPGLPPPAADPDPVRSPPAAAAPPAIPAAPSPEVFSLDGLWLFVPSTPNPPSAKLYSPEYIELLIHQHQTAIKGRYVARYLVPDLAISPDVIFDLTGISAERTAQLSWSAPDGASGQAQFRLLTARALEMTWWTTRPGRTRALASGAAVLVRQQGS